PPEIITPLDELNSHEHTYNRPPNAAMAFQSPPASRKSTLHGEPRKTRAPIMAKKPTKKRTRGKEPPLGLNSLKARLDTSEPRTNARISGLIYWTSAAR
ncbi:MAG TPA: hypothetical protein PK528_12965, partial [Syntrophorhabdus sp.]|nr:hypothetical protein [Syntrophorhabdus sp.]